MNHVFKKIWNTSLGKMVVTSENAKSAGKSNTTTGTRHTVLKPAIGIIASVPSMLKPLVLSMGLMVGGQVWAGVVCTLNTTVGTPSTALGTDAIACGIANTASGNYSSALGYSNTASGEASSALGYNNTASNWMSSALGYGNIASHFGGSAIGTTNQSSSYSDVAFGAYNKASSSSSYYYIASAVGMGVENYAYGVNASAIGSHNSSLGANAVAMGSGTAATSSISVSSLGIGDRSPQTDLSTGKITQIDGVAVTTSAVDWTALKNNPSLLSAVNGVTLTAEQAQAFVRSVAFGGNVALTENSNVFGIQSMSVAKNATAIGYNSLANEDNTISVGKAGAEKRITNVATATKGTDAVNLTQVQGLLSAAGAGASDNYDHHSSDTALGNASGIAHSIVTDTAGNKTIGGIRIESTTQNINDITAFWTNGTNATKITDTAQLAAFKNAAQKGGNLAVGQYSNAIGVENVVSGSTSTAVGYQNIATGSMSNAVGYRNVASQFGSTALGHDNVALDTHSTAIGANNYSQNISSVAIGANISVGRPLAITKNTLDIITSINGIPVTATGNSTNTITHVNGTALNATQRQAFLDRLGWGGESRFSK